MPSTHTLYQHDSRLALLDAVLTEQDGDVTEGDELLADYLSALDDREQVLDGLASLHAEIEARAAARKAEAKRLADLARRDKAAADRIKAALLHSMQQRGERKVETPRYRLTVARAGGATPVEVTTDPATLPERFQRVSVAADLTELRKALEAGEQIEGAALGERSTYLRIR